MADDDERRIQELERDVEELMVEVDRYRTATEDALQQLDWCIGYFVGCGKSGLARSLGANRAHIRKHVLKRAEQPVPAGTPAESD
ncbi:hypothetical protein OH802_13900 [Nocardioides sp. NBC_00850]|uniref:hypothetical protein n=1 Tax=Nocardioides sp. NBC_00850 TaxID=2976001 RepID=UPI00386989C4|nr:hypothetical protein OH802_13900 [Nocardioides sp. NBC_00850]